MIYVFTDGRILYDENFLTQDDNGKYVAVETLPEIPEVTDKVGVITGCNLETKEILWEYFDIPEEPIEPELPEPPIPEPTISPEQLQAEILLNQQKIMTRQDTQESVLAQLLLKQQGGIADV